MRLAEFEAMGRRAAALDAEMTEAAELFVKEATGRLEALMHLQREGATAQAGTIFAFPGNWMPTMGTCRALEHLALELRLSRGRREMKSDQPDQLDLVAGRRSV